VNTHSYIYRVIEERWRQAGPTTSRSNWPNGVSERPELVLIAKNPLRGGDTDSLIPSRNCASPRGERNASFASRDRTFPSSA
jgi:hypothetical protein